MILTSFYLKVKKIIVNTLKIRSHYHGNEPLQYFDQKQTLPVTMEKDCEPCFRSDCYLISWNLLRKNIKFCILDLSCVQNLEIKYVNHCDLLLCPYKESTSTNENMISLHSNNKLIDAVNSLLLVKEKKIN